MEFDQQNGANQWDLNQEKTSFTQGNLPRGFNRWITDVFLGFAQPNNPEWSRIDAAKI